MPEAWQWVPYCGPAPPPGAWLSRWNTDPVLLVALAGLAVWAALRWRQPAGSVQQQRQRRALGSAWGLTVLLYVSPLCALSSAFFTVRVVHHMALVLLVAPLLACGCARPLRRLAAPLWPCTATAALIFWSWHVPAPYAAALTSVPVYALMQFSILIAALFFWLAVRRADPASAIAAVLASTVWMGLLGALIAFASRPLYAPHFASSLAWGVSPLEDQQRAGILMWAPGSFAYLLVAMWMGWRWLRAGQGGAPQAGLA